MQTMGEVVEISSSRGDEEDDTETDEGVETDETGLVWFSVESSVRGL